MAYNGIPGSTSGVQGFNQSGFASTIHIGQGQYGGFSVSVTHPQQQQWPALTAGFPNTQIHTRQAAVVTTNQPGYIHQSYSLHSTFNAPVFQRAFQSSYQWQMPVHHAPPFAQQPYTPPGYSSYNQQNLWQSYASRSAPVNPHTQYFGGAIPQQKKPVVAQPSDWQRPPPMRNYQKTTYLAPAPLDLQKDTGKSYPAATYSKGEAVESKASELPKKHVISENPPPVQKKPGGLRSKLRRLIPKRKHSLPEELPSAKRFKSAPPSQRKENIYEGLKPVPQSRSEGKDVYTKPQPKSMKGRPLPELPDSIYSKPQPAYASVDLEKKKKAQDPLYQPLKFEEKKVESHYQALPPKGEDSSDSGNPNASLYANSALPEGEDFYSTPRLNAGSLSSSSNTIYSSADSYSSADLEDDSSSITSSPSTVDSAIEDPSQSNYEDIDDIEELLKDELNEELKAENEAPAPPMTKNALKAQQKDFETFVNKRKTMVKDFYKAQKIHHKKVQEHLKTVKEADDLIKAGNTAKGSELIFKSIENLGDLQNQTDAMKLKVAAAVAERAEVRNSLTVETMPGWFLSFEAQLAGQLKLDAAVDKHHLQVLSKQVSFDGRYESEVIQLGRQLANALKNAGTAR